MLSRYTRLQQTEIRVARSLLCRVGMAWAPWRRELSGLGLNPSPLTFAAWCRVLHASLWKRLFWEHLCRAALGAAARRRAPHDQFVSSLANVPGRFGFSVPGKNGPGQHGETPTTPVARVLRRPGYHHQKERIGDCTSHVGGLLVEGCTSWIFQLGLDIYLFTNCRTKTPDHVPDERQHTGQEIPPWGLQIKSVES